MTIIAAYMDDEHCVIGSDSMGATSYVKYEMGTKLIDKGTYTVGYCGSYRVADLIEEDTELPESMKDLAALRRFRDRLIDLTDPKEMKASLVLVSPHGIFGIESDFSLDRVDTKYFAAGSGEELALGSMYNSRKMGDPAEVAVQTAVEAAIQHLTTCGFNVHLKCYEVDND